MIAGYEYDQNMVIKQTNIKNKIYYDELYTDVRYSSNHILCKRMSYLRLGYMLSELGFCPKSILDVGYGNGEFLKCASKIINKCYGYDIPPAYPLENIKIVDNIYKNKYDVVTFFDSLEHFEDIYEIKNLNCNYIYISVPWCHYIDDNWFQNWKHRRPDEHLWHFDLNSLSRFMDNIGYEILCYSDIEDTIRKPVDGLANILTCIFKKKYA